MPSSAWIPRPAGAPPPGTALAVVCTSLSERHSVKVLDRSPPWPPSLSGSQLVISAQDFYGAFSASFYFFVLPPNGFLPCLENYFLPLAFVFYGLSPETLASFRSSGA
ncbi:hypothetical protein GUJ93_ZPchr0008g12976 [Zizania palustris]|uniref:Uncharacterized protein n=1 Tax=Zizania palustris TaxID=103762 RepID=A0A8J5V568_ZIZPA|nr:hypothetical protein GUJ93_ZPchr0008g12976 [Zizania palustris]